jgi:hypothetical protein
MASTQKKSVKRKMTLGGPLPIRSLNSATANSLRNGAPCSIGSNSSGTGQYGGSTVARGGEEYLMLVVQRYSGEWAYVRVNQHCLDVISLPIVFSELDAGDLLELWKRVVVDNAIPWEDSVRPETLRIVKYRCELQDVTLSLFGDDQSVADFMRINAMAKLSDAEARLLGLTTLKAKQKMIHAPEFHRDDQNNLKSLTQSSASLPLDALLANLSGG